ncbi:MAG: hypothetical protein WC543_00110 [Candidatus Omnitrophota bacterium]
MKKEYSVTISFVNEDEGKMKEREEKLLGILIEGAIKSKRIILDNNH